MGLTQTGESSPVLKIKTKFLLQEFSVEGRLFFNCDLRNEKIFESSSFLMGFNKENEFKEFIKTLFFRKLILLFPHRLLSIYLHHLEFVSCRQ